MGVLTLVSTAALAISASVNLALWTLLLIIAAILILILILGAWMGILIISLILIEVIGLASLFLLHRHNKLLDNLSDLVHILDSLGTSLTNLCLVSLEVLSVFGVLVLHIAILFDFIVVHMEIPAIDS